MRLVFLRIAFVVSILVLVGIAVAIVFGAGTPWETPSPTLQVAPPPTPTELPTTEKEIAERAKQYLREHAAEYSLRPDLSDLKVLRVNTSPVADIVDFQQLYQGIPVEKSGINVVIPRDSKQSIQVGSSYNPRVILRSTTPPYPGQAVASPSAKISSSDAAARAWLAIGAKGKLFRPVTPSLVVYPLEKPGQPPLYTLAWHIEISTVNPNGQWTVFVDAETGEVLSQKSTLQLDCANPPCDPNPPFTPRPTALPSRTPIPITPTSKTYSIPGWQSPTIPPSPLSKPTLQPLPATPNDLLQPSDKIQFYVLPTATLAPSRTPPVPSTPSGPKPSPPIIPTPLSQNQSPIRVANTNTPAGWNTLVSENFEGTWPTGLWQRWGDPTWGTTNYMARTGSKSAWCAASALDPRYYYYPNNMNSWMVYGPIDLSRATTAYLDFSYWNQSQLNYDFFGLVASVNGQNFYWVWWTSGDSGGWQDVTFDFAGLPGMGNLLGQSNVWIALVFTSNDSNIDNGAFVDNVSIRTYTPMPNITPYTPTGWASPLVPSSVPGINYIDTLLADGTTYVDWAITNNGDATANSFYVTLYLDGSPIAEWYVANLYSGGVASVVDWQMPFRPSPGWHLLKLVADSRGSVGESNEGDNVREEWFYWHAPNLTPFTPSGWDYPVVPSSVWGTYTVGNLFAGRDTYIDWAITNNGTVPAYNFYVRLYLDNVAFYELYINQLNPGQVESRADILLNGVSAGTHSLKMIVDPTNVMQEQNENDNVWERDFNWRSQVGWVFDPSPLVTSRDITLRDNNDQDSVALTNQLRLVTLQGLGTTGRLRGAYVDLTSSPAIGGCSTGVAYDPYNVYLYTRSDDRFEEVMPYYHIDLMQRYIQSLGFTNIVNRSIPVYPHCGTTGYYDDAGVIALGRLYADAGEDAEGIAHEYGHAIQHSQIGKWLSPEGSAMGEGFGYYWPASFYSAQNSTDPLPPAPVTYRTCFAEWLYWHNPPTCTWPVISTKHYPEDMVNNAHQDGQIWSGALWEIWSALGRTATDRIILQSHYQIRGIKSYARFGEGADAIVEADQLWNNGANLAVISDVFRRRGIFDAYELDNSAATAKLIPTTDSPQRHNFHSISDEDWVKFNALGGYEYYIRTANLESNADTVLELYSTNGSTLIATNNDCQPGNRASCIIWIAPSTAMYYVKARPQSTSTTGRNTGFDLTIARGAAPSIRIYLPLILK